MKDAVLPSMSAQVESVVHLVNRLESVDLSAYNPEFLARTLQHLTQMTGVRTAAEYSDMLHQSADVRMSFVRALEVPYSLFFRDPVVFAWLLHIGVPRMLDSWPHQGTPYLRIWSAGCGAGQEAWSLAMILESLREGRNGMLSGCVVGSDRSHQALACAREATYTLEQFDQIPMGLMRRYVDLHETTGQIGPRCRSHVSFTQHDLLDLTTPAPPAGVFRDFNLIVCCNVLIYYRPDVQIRVMRRLAGCLSPGGLLVTSEPERSIANKTPELHSISTRIPVYTRRDSHT